MLHSDAARSALAVARATAALALVALPALAAPPAVPELGPLVSGTSSLVEGTFVWTDYAYDDHGANTVDTSVIGPRGGAPGSAQRSGGDAVYPAWAAPGNTADLIQLQLSGTPQGIGIRAILETLVDPKLPILGVAFDVDANPSTGAAALPGGRWPALDPLGIELLAILSSAGTELRAYDAASASWSTIASFEASVDPAANTLEGRLHNGALPPTTGSWRAFGVLGLRNPETGGSWVDGGEPIFDLAFVGGEPFVQWQDMRQADVLVGAFSSSHAEARLDFAKLTSGATELVDETAPGFKTFLYHSALELPEGVTTPNPAQRGQHEYLGPYQPYQVFVPEVITEGNPLLVSMHGANNNHMESIFAAPFGLYVGTSRVFSDDPFLIGMFVPDFGYNAKLPVTLQIYVLGRGETLNYRGIGEIDVLEATDDAAARFGTDPDRVTLKGSSMGGIGAFRLGTLYPDRWAAIIPHIGTGVSYRSLFANLRNVPVREINGFLDAGELGPPSENDAITLDGLDLEHHYWLMLDRGHDGPGYIQCVFEQAAEFVRNPDPPQVAYLVDPAFFQNDPSRDIDIVYDSAYWVSGIALRDASSAGRVDASSQALPHATDLIVRNEEVRENITAGRDLCGDNPDFAPGWTPAFPAGETWRERSLVRVPGPPEPLANALSLELANVGAVALDLARAGFGSGQAGSLAVSSDGEVALTLTGLRHRALVFVDGIERARASLGGGATVTVPSGDHAVSVGACLFGAQQRC